MLDHDTTVGWVSVVIVPGINYVKGRNYTKDSKGNPVKTEKFGIAVHNTSNNASDEREASYATRRTDSVSSHFYMDDDSVTQSLDTDWRAWHSGSTNGNSYSISLEFTGGNGKSRSWWLANIAWDKVGEVLAKVIKHHWPDGSFAIRRASVDEMKRNAKVKAFYGHDDMRRAWGGTNHTDPGPNFPWDKLFEVVNKALNADSGSKPAPTPKPKPASRPAPEPTIAFPLPTGYYFGPKNGPAQSVSGYYGRKFKGKTDREWIKTWAGQLAKRGWSIGKGKRWLTKYGNDGLYGSEYRELIIAFQKDQDLIPDGKLGLHTWNAAYRNPVT